MCSASKSFLEEEKMVVSAEIVVFSSFSNLLGIRVLLWVGWVLRGRGGGVLWFVFEF